MRHRLRRVARAITEREMPRAGFLYSQAMRGMPAGDSPQYLIVSRGPRRVVVAAARCMRACLMRTRRGSGAPAMTSAQYTLPELACAEAMPICVMPPFSILARWPAERFHMSSAAFRSLAPYAMFSAASPRPAPPTRDWNDPPTLWLSTPERAIACACWLARLVRLELTVTPESPGWRR